MNTNNTFTGGAGATNGNTLYVANLGSKADTKSAIGTGATITLGTPTSSGSLRWLGSAGNESSDKDFSLAGTNSILADGPTNATLTLSGAINSTNATNKTITFASYKSNTLTINGFINEFTGSTNSVVIGVSSSGTVVLGNATNSFSGPITISQTTTNQSTILQTASIGNSNSASPLGKNGTINIGNSFFPATLKYTGTGEMPNKVINLAGTTGGAILDQSGTGNLKFTSAMTATGAGAKTITLQGSSAGTGELGGNISDLGGNVISLKKSGTGTWTLSGSNSYSGDTTVSDGTLALAAGNINSTLVSITGSTNAILKLMATTSLASKASFAGDNSSTSTGTLDLNAGGGYTFNSYGPSAANPGLNMAFTNSSGSPVTVTFTNSTNYITDPTGSGGGKSIWNRSTNLTLVFNGKMEIGSSATNSLGLSGDGNFILNGSVTNSGGGTRGLNKIGSGTATLNADNSYNGPTVVSGGTLQIGPSGTLPVASSITVSNGAAIKFNQASGTNNVGPLTVAGTLDQNLITITSSGAVDLTGSTLKVNGTPTLTSYTLVSGTSLTGTPTLSPAISGYSLSTSGNDLLLVAAPSGLSYASISSTVGTAITSVNPTVTGTPTSYSIFPALPAGLTFSTTTGVISGAPSATAASATYTVTATNAGGSTTATFIVAVGKATPTISAAPAASDITFGQTLADSNLTGGTASTPGSFAFTTPSTSPNVGTADQGVTFTPNDTANYSTATASVSVTVGKATPTISAAPAASDITFGQTLADSNLTGGTASTPGSFAFTTPSTSPNVGTANQGVTFTPSDTVNYNTATTTVSVTVNKADATVTWPTAAAITYGDALSAATLSGGSGEGTFAFTSPLTVPNAGIAQIFEVTFTPTSANYKAATQMVSVMVNKAMPTITVPPTASPITYGQTLASSLLSSGTASVAGSFAFTTTSTGPSAGTASQGVTFTPADTANYSTATTSVSVTVNPASLSSSDITLVPTGDGSYTASATGVSGFTYSYAGRNQTSYGPSATAPTVAGFYTVTASANGNHSGSASVDYSVTGPVAVGDSLTKPAGNAAYLIPVSELLANDFRITNTSGATAFGGLTVSAVTSGSGNTATVAGAYIQFTPSSASTDTFTYTVTDGAKTATCTVTLTTETQAPTFRLQIVKVGTAAFSAPNTSVMHDFIGVPNQTYLVEYTTDLDNGPWTSAGNQSTGPKGSFSVTITKSGDFVSEWNTHMFFRARLVR
jgi:autotransporter-associated beta strand protein